MITQSQQFYDYITDIHEAGVVSVSAIRADESLHGWLNVRTNSSMDGQV